MPFMIGRGALRRTLEYLEKGQIILRDQVNVLTFQCNTGKAFPHHEGLRNFIFWHLPQLKYKNPDVQMVTFKRMTPTPWICAYLEDNRKVYIDCDSRSREEIHSHVKLLLGKSQERLQKESREEKAILLNPANFGPLHARHCICTTPGQVPCPGFEPLPKELTGKWRAKMREEAEDQ